MVVGLLGILRAGGVYVPLDPGYPQKRLDFLLADSAASLVLTQDHLRHRLAGSTAPLLGLDDLQLIPCPSFDPTPSPLAPLHAAYVIYTSGSTGQPKGVVVEHRNAVHLAHAQARLLGIAPGHRVLQFSAPGFDASIWEVLMTLLSGATLCVPPPDAPLYGPDLLELLRRSRVTAAT